MADKTKSPFTEKERYLLDVEQRRDMAESYPDGLEAQWLRERARLAGINPQGPEAREIQEETRRALLYGNAPEGDKLQDQNNKKEAPPVTPEQKTNVDKALGETQLSDKIGGASDVNANPVPNEPTALDKSKDLGQDLQRQGVAMDKDK